MKLFLVLFASLATAAVGQTLTVPGCETESTTVETCIKNNPVSCAFDQDPKFCAFDENIDYTDDRYVDVGDFDPAGDDPPCDPLSVAYCDDFGSLCCSGKCKTEIDALMECAYTTYCGGGAIACPDPTGAPTSPPVDAPAPVPAPAPTPSPGCFSATSTVQVLGQGPVKMEDLKVGDQVLAGKSGQYDYQTMYAFGHRATDSLGDFYVISTNDYKSPLEMTGEHLIHVAGKTNPVRADSLNMGDVLLSTSTGAEHAVVTSIHKVTKPGLYAPLTPTGDLVVNGISVSSYVALQEADQEYIQVGLADGSKVDLLSHQSFVHLTLTPFRMMCMGVSSRLCNTFDAEGIPHYIGLGMKLVHWLDGQSMLVQMIFAILLLPIFVALFFLENIFGSSVAPLALFVMALLARKVPTIMFKSNAVNKKEV